MPEEWITGRAREDPIAITNHEIKEAQTRVGARHG